MGTLVTPNPVVLSGAFTPPFTRERVMPVYNLSRKLPWLNQEAARTFAEANPCPKVDYLDLSGQHIWDPSDYVTNAMHFCEGLPVDTSCGTAERLASALAFFPFVNHRSVIAKEAT